MEDRVTDRPIPVAGAERIVPPGFTLLSPSIDLHSAAVDAIGEALLRRDGLGVEIRTPVCVIPAEPLVRVQVKDVGLLGTGMKVSEDDGIVQVGVMYVRRIVTELLQQRRVAVGPRCQKEFFVQAFDAICGGSDPLSVGKDHRPHTAGAVIDCEPILDPGQLPFRKQAEFLVIARHE